MNILIKLEKRGCALLGVFVLVVFVAGRWQQVGDGLVQNFKERNTAAAKEDVTGDAPTKPASVGKVKAKSSRKIVR